MSIPVKWFHSNMTGAPQFSSSGGSIIQILDACLINGFNAQSVDSLTYDSGTGKCTAVVNAGHGFEDYQVVLIEGANETEYNGEVRVTAVDSTTFTYTPDTAPTVATATGAITAKAAPVGGWEKRFSGSNKGVYASIDALAAPGVLRIDDNNGKSPLVQGCRSATDVDTVTDPYPASAIKWWAEAGNFWALVADGRTLYLLDADGPSWSKIMAYGDFHSYVVGDADSKLLSGGDYSSNSWYGVVGNDRQKINLQADHLGVADCEALASGNRCSYPWGTGGSSVDPVAGEIVLYSNIVISENTSGAIRGLLRGAYQPLHDAGDPGFFAVIDVAGRLFASMRDKAHGGVVFVDLEGAW